jgi:hypothetical protein
MACLKRKSAESGAGFPLHPHSRIVVVVSALATDIAVDRVVVERAVLPAPEQSADPFERQSSDSGVMGLTRCEMPRLTNNTIQ